MRTSMVLRVVTAGVTASLLASCLFLTACDKTAPAASLGLGNGGGNYPPGSVAEFNNKVGDTVHFETDSPELTPEGRQIVMGQAVWLRQYANYPVNIEGHADERGTREYNIALGAKRAETVKNTLISQGVDPHRLHTLSYGKERPVAVCDNISCWSQNRRSVTIINAGGAMAYN
jgi:peptidoglycan-associated lipoprotein